MYEILIYQVLFSYFYVVDMIFVILFNL